MKNMENMEIEKIEIDKIDIKRLHICDQPHTHWYEQIVTPYEQESLHNNKHMFDAYTLTHMFWPLLGMLVLKKFTNKTFPLAIIIFIIANIFEIYENLPNQIVKYNRIEVDSSGTSTYRGDSTINIIGDIIFDFIGVYAGYKLTSDRDIIFLLLLLFTLITRTVGIKYWTEFISFALT